MIYLDNAATTKPLPCAMDEYERVIREVPYNPSSEHQAGQAAREELESAREGIALCIGSKPEQIFFCSGSTEAAWWAVNSLREHFGGKWLAYISQLEHHAISENIAEKPLYYDGRVWVSQLANNETGELEVDRPHTDKEHVWLSDGTSAVGHVRIDLDQVYRQPDVFFFTAHKLGGVPGAAVLYARSPEWVKPLIRGGGQERGMRAGTENVPAICAMAAALEWQTEHMDENTQKIGAMRQILVQSLSRVENHKWNTPFETPCVPHILNISFDGVDARALSMLLSKEGVMVSPGAACSNGLNEPSHVIMAMYHDEARARSALRISLSHTNTPDECVEAAEKIKNAVAYLRSLS